MRARRRLVLPVTALLVCGGAAAASAQWMGEETVPADTPAPGPSGPVLHEYVAPPGAGGAGGGNGGSGKPKTLGGDPQAGKNPWGVRSRDKILPEPRKDQKPAATEPVMGTRDFGADRDTSANPDYATGADSTLHYVEVFNPAIVPFKRMSVLDAVDDNYMLHVHDKLLVELPVGGKSTTDRDLFWASMVVQLTPGEDVPIPSTSPDMRIMSYEIDPPVSVTFSKDGADNYFVRSNDAKARGVFRLVFLSDAPASYFAADVPRGYAIADAAALGVRPVAPRAYRAAQQVLDKIDVQPSTPLDVAVDRLVEYFRRFEAGEAPPRTDDIYLDLALSRRGVCRHRAFAFVVTANALGIPARYVTNEAHAFAEIKVPEVGWIRIDLGGAALNLDVTNAGDKQMYRPRNADPFPKPPEYADNYTQLRGDIKGLSRDQIDQVRQPGPGNGGRDPGSTDPVSPSPGQGLPAPPPSAYQGKTPTRVVVDGVSDSGFRGESLRVGGQIAADDGTPLANVPVNVYLAPAGRGGDGARLLGETVTGPDGRFEADVDLPRDLALGRHEVFASTPGDARHQPALSQ